MINVLFCFDDNDWNYARHCAVSMISLLETNKMNKIKIFIMTSFMSQENIDEFKRIVNQFNQEIEFIISENIIPEELKSIIINRKNLTRWAWYRLFFPLFIKWIERILYLDCDVLVIKDISDIYNRDMNWKAIAWYYDTIFSCYKNKLFNLKNYINSGILLFDVWKYQMDKISVKKMKEINNLYSNYFNGCDQDKINIIFKDDIFVYKEWMNYLIENKYINKWIQNAQILHCLEKPYVKYSSIPDKIRDLYYNYLNLTKWKWYPEQEAKFWFIKYLYNSFYLFFSRLLAAVLPESIMKKLITTVRILKQKIIAKFS